MSKKHLLVILFIFLTLSSIGQTLSTATIKFLTPKSTDDKDGNTYVSVVLNKCGSNDNIAILEPCCNGVSFPDNGTFSQDFKLKVVNPVNKGDIISGSFTIHIDPKGNDRWVFNPTLVLVFSDGTSKTITGFSNRIVAQDAKDATFAY